MRHYFGEKEMEYHAKFGGEIPVWQSPKFEVARQKAIEIIESGKYGVADADFWILMNATKSGKMMYTGLIISHNGCLKINDCLASRFDPECVSVDKDGYNGSLVFSYCNAAQGIYEVGEVSAKNCANDYPYAMAYKRLFDRVVLKLSKLAYAGIYSDSESDEFTQRLEAVENAQNAQQETAIPVPRVNTAEKPKNAVQGDSGSFTPYCVDCGQEISVKVHDYAVKKYKKPLCMECQKKQ